MKTRLIIIMLSLLTAALVASAGDTKPVPIGNRHQLLVDDFVIESSHSLVREQGTVVKCRSNPVMRREFPWEASRCELYGSAFWDPSIRKIRLYYSAMSVPYQIQTAYAESKDGVHWTKPMFDIYPFGDAKLTNILWPGRYVTHGPSVFRDEHDADPTRRYKLLTADFPVPPSNTSPEKGPVGIDVCFSPDGVKWTPAPGNPVIAGLVSDTGQCVFWDANKRKYVAYLRTWLNGRLRSVTLSESADFVHWSDPKVVYSPTEEDQKNNWQFYSLSVTPYEGMYIGLVWIFPEVPESRDWNADTPVTWPELAISRDGKTWERVAFGKPFIPLGPKGAFDHRQIRTASSLVLMGDKILCFYAGSPDPHVAAHKYEIGMAEIKRDRFASMKAGSREGELVTKPLVLPTGSLYVNAEVEPGGSIRAEIIDSRGIALPGYSLAESDGFTGDSLSGRLTWRGRSALPPSSEVGTRVKFLMRKAKLYSFWVDR